MGGEIATIHTNHEIQYLTSIASLSVLCFNLFLSLVPFYDSFIWLINQCRNRNSICKGTCRINLVHSMMMKLFNVNQVFLS